MMETIRNSAKNLEDIKEINLFLIITLLQKLKVCSRAELAKQSGLRQSTITNIINELIRCGLVREVGSMDGRKGRRSIAITLNGQLLKVIGIRLARTHFMVGLYDICGNENDVRIQQISKDEVASETLQAIIGASRQLIQKYREQILAIGIAVPGPFIMENERIALMTGTYGWEKINIRKRLEDEFDLPVYMEHDAKAGALAEWWFGHNNLERGTFIYIAAGQGIGSGVIVDGKLLHGDMGVAGEIGHMSIDYNGPKCQCGNNGCLELYCSVMAMVKNINQQIAGGRKTILPMNCSMQQIAQAIEANDGLALETVERAAHFLGIGIANIVNAYNPGTIIIGDEMAQVGDRLLNVINETLKDRLLPELRENLRIRFTSFKRDPALMGAIALAVDNSLRKPSYILKICQKNKS